MKYIKTYKLYETSEWNKDIDWEYVKNNPAAYDNNSDEVALIKDLHDKLDDVISYLDNDEILKIEDIRGEDFDYGAYAIVSIFGKTYTVTEIYSENFLYIQGFPINNMNDNTNYGYKGDILEISELLNDIYLTGGIEIYQSIKKFNI